MKPEEITKPGGDVGGDVRAPGATRTERETLRLDRLRLENFRCFERCEIELHPKLTVLVGDNAQGKTALLDAIGLAMRPLVAALAGQRPTHGFRPSDVRLQRNQHWMQPALPMKVAAEGWVGAAWYAWKRTVSTAVATQVWSTTTEVARLVAAGERMRARATSAGLGAPLPMIAHYGTERSWREPSRGPSRRPAASRNESCFSKVSFDAFEEWYELASEEIGDPITSVSVLNERRALVLAAVEEAITTALAPVQWSKIEVERAGELRGHLVAEHPENGRLPISWLGDGIRNMIALVGDLAHRCVRLNPQLGPDAATQTPGLLLIDEVDLHLHPSWQQRVVELLQRAFPRMQLVLTTQSPHVLSTVDVQSIRVTRVRDGVGELATPKFQTRGVQSADVLAQIMGVDPVPRVREAEVLHEYCAMIERGLGETNDAVALLHTLEGHFGAHHPVMIDCDRLLRFQSFKRERARRKTT